MQHGTIVNLHLARVQKTPSEPVQQATALSNQGLEGDRSCKPGALRQVLVMDKETLDNLPPGGTPNATWHNRPGQSSENPFGASNKRQPSQIRD